MQTTTYSHRKAVEPNFSMRNASKTQF